jgi:DNA-binding transcriptional MerR regulator
MYKWAVMKSAAENLRQQKYIGVAELADMAARLLVESGPVQERGTVSEVPDERTVRYYLTEGLLAPAEEKQGTASVFGYLHLLQLLAIKNLQAQHLPIRKIRELVEGRSEHALERLLGIESKQAGKHAALSYLESLLTQTRAAPPPAPTAARFSASAAQANAAASAPMQPTAQGHVTGTWERIELEPGLELHIHSAYRPPAEAKRLRRLAAAVMHAVTTYSRKLTGKRGK